MTTYEEELITRKQEANELARSKKYVEALKMVLEGLPVREKNASRDLPPVDRKNDDERTRKEKKAAIEEAFTRCKNVAADAVVSTLLLVDPKEFGKVFKELSNDMLDTLMKFVYRGFEMPGVEYGNLLKAHDEICKIANLGPVIRSIHTRLEV